jgi:hypothetical protein
MPAMSSIELQGHWLSQESHMPFGFITAFSAESARTRAEGWRQAIRSTSAAGWVYGRIGAAKHLDELIVEPEGGRLETISSSAGGQDGNW